MTKDEFDKALKPSFKTMPDVHGMPVVVSSRRGAFMTVDEKLVLICSKYLTDAELTVVQQAAWFYNSELYMALIPVLSAPSAERHVVRTVFDVAARLMGEHRKREKPSPQMMLINQLDPKTNGVYAMSDELAAYVQTLKRQT